MGLPALAVGFLLTAGAASLAPARAEPPKPDAVKPEPANIEAPAAAAAKADTATPAAAQPTSQPTPKIALELNKLETTEKGCRIYMVTSNASDAAYPTYQLDLVLFQPDGVIAKRIGMDIGPIKPLKRSLKLFDLDGLKCDRIGSVLVNDAMDCKSASGGLSQSECLAGLTLSSLGSVKISK